MHIGVTLPNWGPLASPAALRAITIAAEERGFDSVWASDHVVMPTGRLKDYPYSADGKPPFSPDTPFYEPLATLAWLAASTQRIQLATGVVILPLRQPLLLAKEVATIDVLSEGRVVLGVGVGWLPEEFDLLGQSFTDRGARTDAAIRTLRAAWSETPVLPDSGTGIGMRPAPTQGPQVPIVIGGHSPAALHRAALLGDAWYSSGLDAEGFGAMATQVRDLTRELRPDAAVQCANKFVVADPREAPRLVDAMTRAGADFLALDVEFATMTLDQVLDWLHNVADRIDRAPGEPLAAVPAATSA